MRHEDTLLSRPNPDGRTNADVVRPGSIASTSYGARVTYRSSASGRGWRYINVALVGAPNLTAMNARSRSETRLSPRLQVFVPPNVVPSPGVSAKFSHRGRFRSSATHYRSRLRPIAPTVARSRPQGTRCRRPPGRDLSRCRSCIRGKAAVLPALPTSMVAVAKRLAVPSGGVDARRRGRSRSARPRGRRPQALAAAVVARQSLSRLWVAVISRHSERQAARPRRWKRSILRLNLVSAKTGSIIAVRLR
jgi:hypothetical protein